MKKLLTAVMILAAISFGCSKTKPAEDAQPQPAPAVDSAAPAADSAAPAADSAAPKGDAESNNAQDAATRSVKEFNGKEMQVAPEGPKFILNYEEDGDKITIKSTDDPQKPMEYDYAGELFVDDINFDGFQDIAFRTIAADFEHYMFLIWNKDTKKFDAFENTSNSGINLDPQNKTITLFTFSHFWGDGPAGCVMQLGFDGTKPVQKLWNNRPKDGGTRVKVEVKDMDKKLFSHLESLTFEFREADNGVKCYIADCKDQDELFTIPDATTKDMVQTDLNNDGITDLQFHAKSDPSKLIDVLWTKDLNTFWYESGNE